VNNVWLKLYCSLILQYTPVLFTFQPQLRIIINIPRRNTALIPELPVLTIDEYSIRGDNSCRGMFHVDSIKGDHYCD